MDREAAVIRTQMSHTRADLDQKIARLEAKARQLTPKALSARYLPEFFVDRAIGAGLLMAGVVLTVVYRRRVVRPSSRAGRSR